MASPTQIPTALLIIDMINALAFEDGRKLLRQAQPAAGRIARLRQRASRAGIPVIYANDNYGQWRSDFRQVVELCGGPDSVGAPLVRALSPGPDDYFVLKPHQSAFHQSPLPLLLEELGIGRLILTGISSDSCVLATAVDAHMRKYPLLVPADCVASLTKARNERALQVMRENLQADVRVSTRITAALMRQAV